MLAASQQKRPQKGAGDKSFSLGFLCCCQRTADGGYIGGLLVTTEDGLPLEFRCTSPVKPTPAQKILYGGTLEPHVRAHLISDALLKACTNKPDVVVTDHESALALRPSVDVPIVWVRRQEGSIQLASGDGSATPTRDVIRPLAEGVASMVVTVHKEFADELSKVTTLLMPLTESIDLTEPFERVHKALEEVQRQRSG